MQMLFEQFKNIFDRPEKVKKLRELILQLAVRGKLVEQDENDEPASVLLERIKEEKERLVKEGRIKKENPLSEICEDEKPYELPMGWKWMRLGNLTQKIGAGSTPKGGRNIYIEDGIKFIRSQNVYNDGLRTKDIAYISEEINNKMFGSIVKAKDLLINITGGSIGRCCIVPENFDIGNVNQHVSIVRCIDYSIINYLHMVLISPYIFNFIMDVQVGISREGLSISKLASFAIPLPPLNEQKRIVEKVDLLMLLCDSLEKELQRKVKYSSLSSKSVFNSIGNCSSLEELEETLRFIIENFKELTLGDDGVKELKNAILQLAVQGELVSQDPEDEPASVLLKKIKEEKERLIKEGKIKKEKPLPEISEGEKPYELPEGWRWARIGTIFITTSGSTPSRVRSDFYDNGSINWVKTRDLNNRLVIKCEEKVSQTAVEECKLSILPINTVCIAMYGGSGTIGKCGILGVETTINQSVCGILPNELFYYKFLYYFILYVRPHWMNFASGSRIDPNINRNIIKNMLLPVPPLNEQKRIVEKVNSLMALCDELEKRIEKSKKYSQKLMEALLKDTFTQM